MADQVTITPDIIAKRAVKHLENASRYMGVIDTQHYANEFNKKVGETISIRRPVRFEGYRGANLNKQQVFEGKTTLTVREQTHVAWEFDTRALTLSVEEYDERYVKPAMITLANIVDRDIAAEYKGFYNSIGTPGTTPANTGAIGLCARRAVEMAWPEDGNWGIVLDSDARQTIAAANSGLYVSDIARDALREGKLGRLEKFDTYESANAPTHVNGDFAPSGASLEMAGAVTPTTYDAVRNTWAQTVAIDGFDTGKGFKKGDVITIENVYAVNPIPGVNGEGKKVMPYLQEFVVQADVNETAGAANVSISPPIITTGPYQTVSAAPANNADVTPKGSAGVSYPQNIFCHKDAISMATLPLVMPDGVSFKSQRSYKGMNLRVLKDYDINTDREVIRVDMMYALDNVAPHLGGRLWG